MIKPIVYTSEYGDRYLPVEHFPTFSLAADEMANSEGWEDEDISRTYGGIEIIPLHYHDIEDYESCPNYDDDVGDAPDPCLGYVKCHVFEL